MSNRFLTWAAFAAILGTVACSEAPNTAAKSEADSTKAAPAAPAGPVTAKTAFWEMYKPARAWSTDQLLLGLQNKPVEGVKDEPGKAPMWEALFVSQSKNQIRAFTYSVVDQPPTILKGVKGGASLAWGGPTTQSMPIQLNDFTIDSDAAYKTALTKAGPWVEKHPDKTLTYSLGLASRFASPVWYLLWGTKSNGYAVYVNASTGAILDVK